MFKKLIFLIIIAFVFCGCNLFLKPDSESGAGNKTSVPGDNSELKIKPFALSENEISQPLEDYDIDLSKIKFWKKSSDSTDDCGTFDSETKILKLNTKWTAGVIYLNNFDASDYRYIRIDYEPCDDGGQTNLPFRLQCQYGDDDKTTENQLCERKRRVQYLRLNKDLKSSINQIQIWCITDSPVEYKITRLCLTQNKIISEPVIDTGSKRFDTSISAIDLVKQMQLGWNLGNTFDAHSFGWQPNYWEQGIETEFHWEKTETTKELIDFPYANGYRTIRIPVTWFDHIIDDKYTIDPDFMTRVKTIVDYAIEAGYYVILNEHHSVHGEHENTIRKTSSSWEYSKRKMPSPLGYADGYIVSSNETDQQESKRFLNSIWTQIATAFNNGYDEHLIFETMNEPRNARDEHPATYRDRTDHEWTPGMKSAFYNLDGNIKGYWCDNRECSECLAEYKVLNEYNQVCLDAIRATGGNNANRFVMIPGLCTHIETVLKKMDDEERGIFSTGLFEMPQDTANDKLILTVHKYPGWRDEDQNKFSERMQNNIVNLLGELNEQYVKNGIPVVIGETGAEKGPLPYEERLAWAKYLTKTARQYGMAVCWWDCGSSENSMAEIDRVNKKFFEPELVQAMLEEMAK